MSMHQQSNCQNLACRVLYKQLEELCKAVEAAQAIINIIQPIINSQRPLWMPNPDLTPLNTDDGNQSDLDDDDHEETGTENLHCPHSQCKDKESYSNRESLKRHFTNHVGCKTKCRSCGIEIDTVRRYALHFKTCMKGKLSGQPLLNAKKEQRKLNKRATKELDKMCSQSTELGDLDITGNAKKRKDTDTTSPSLRPRLGTSENLASNAFFTSAATEAEPTSCSFVRVAQSWNGASFPITSSEYLPNLGTDSTLLYPVYSKVFNSCTNDWDQNYYGQRAPHAADRNTLPFSDASPNIFADMAEPDPISRNTNPELVALYGVALDTGNVVETM